MYSRTLLFITIFAIIAYANASLLRNQEKPKCPTFHIQMYYSGDTIEDFENTIMSFSKLKSKDKVSKITTYVDSIINDIFPYTQDGLINAISQTLHINEKEAETVLNSHRSLYLLSKSSEENANTLLSLTPIDKQSIVLLYNFLSN